MMPCQHCAGTPGYWITIILQWVNIIFGNVGVMVLGGQSLKGMHDLYNSNQNIKLADWMIVAGAFNGILSLGIPQLHSLRLWSGVACTCTIIFVVIVVGIAAHDGMLPGLSQSAMLRTFSNCEDSWVYRYIWIRV